MLHVNHIMAYCVFNTLPLSLPLSCSLPLPLPLPLPLRLPLPHVVALVVGQEWGELVLLGDVGEDVLEDPGGDVASLLQGEHVTDHLGTTWAAGRRHGL